MPDKAVIYGEIVDGVERQKIQESFPNAVDSLLWLNDSTLFKQSDSASHVFIDLDNPSFSSSEFLSSIATAGGNIKVIGKSENPDIDESIRVAKFGVSEILNSRECTERLSELLETKQNNDSDSKAKNSKFSIKKLVGASVSMADIRKTISLLSEVDFPSALILGETGTGKSFISKILHNTGLRSDHSLVEVNCSAIPDELFESELFGHIKGSFTDARSDKIGLFEYAEGGTLFLDEVGSLSAAAQAKLLKILEDKKLRRVGDVSEKDINVRVVAATNLDFKKAIESGRFREDLYYRLNLLVIEILPLRERREDILPLVEHYRKYYSNLYGMSDVLINDEAKAVMRKHHWPGNIRELCNVIERTILLSKGREIGKDDIETALQLKGRVSLKDRQQIIIDVPPQGIALSDIEENVIKQVLNMCDWNKSEAAKFLQISRPRLRRILDKAGLEQNRRGE